MITGDEEESIEDQIEREFEDCILPVPRTTKQSKPRNQSERDSRDAVTRAMHLAKERQVLRDRLDSLKVKKALDDAGVPVPHAEKKKIAQSMPSTPVGHERWFRIRRLLDPWELSRWVMFLHGLRYYGSPEDIQAAPHGARALIAAVKEAYPSFTGTDLETAILMRLINRAWPSVTKKKKLTAASLKEFDTKGLHERLKPSLCTWEEMTEKVFMDKINIQKDIYDRKDSEA